MITLQQRVDRMPEERRLALALRLVNASLPIWEAHTSGRPIEYRDSVVGLNHSIASDLLRRSIESMTSFVGTSWILRRISGREELLRLEAEFAEPIVSLQDCDFDLPAPVKLTFYSVHNLLDELLKGGRTVFGESHVYVTINQAIDALVQSGRMTDNTIADWIREAEA